MIETFSDNNVMLDTQFFMMKYGVFILAGFVGCIASVGNDSSYNSVKSFIKHLTMTVTLSVVSGILLSNFWDISLEVCFAIVVIIAFFIKKVIIELTQIIDNLSDFATSIITKKLNLTNENKSTIDKDKEQEESSEKYNEQ